MNDMKNIVLAWVSSTSTVFAAIEIGNMVSVISAIVLPTMFFAIGKAIDVALQFHFRGRGRRPSGEAARCKDER